MTVGTPPAHDEIVAPRLGPTRRIHVPTVLAGLLLVIGSALAFGVIARGLAEQRPVLVLSRPVPRGAVLTDADLAIAQIGADAGIRTTPPDARDRLTGRTLLTALPAGSALTADLVADAAVDVGTETRTVGLLLEPGGYPVDTLAPGDVVTVVSTDSRGSVLDDHATVLASDPVVDGSATRLVSVGGGSRRGDGGRGRRGPGTASVCCCTAPCDEHDRRRLRQGRTRRDHRRAGDGGGVAHAARAAGRRGRPGRRRDRGPPGTVGRAGAGRRRRVRAAGRARWHRPPPGAR